MPHLACRSFAFILAASWPVFAIAQTEASTPSFPDVQPFTPFLTINEAPEICAAYEGAWLDIYRSDKGLSERHLDLRQVFPDAVHIVPLEVKSEGEDAGAGGYLRQSSFEFDYDGDAENEILYFESIDVGWRYLGTAIYFYDSEADYIADAPKPEDARKNPHNKRFDWRSETNNPRGKKLASYRHLSMAHVFQIGGTLYSQSDVSQQSGHAVKTSLDWLRPNHKPVSICEVSLSPSVTSILDLESDTPLSLAAEPASAAGFETGQYGVQAALESVYGGPETGGMCYGTMGWRSAPPSLHWSTIHNRPQTMHDGFHATSKRIDMDLSPEADTAREFRYLAWGLKDPTSFEVVRSLKAAYPKFIAEYALYYQNYFDMDAAAAKQTAERAYRFLLDRVFYARQSGPQMNPNYSEGIIAGPETPLDIIANQFMEKALAHAALPKPEVTDRSERAIRARKNLKTGNARRYRTALRLGLLAGGETALMRDLFDALKPISDENLLGHSEKIQAKEEAPRQFMIDDFFLASAGNAEMMAFFLEQGAQADLPTNYFGKTALMYAAQNNDLDTVSLLLKNGADPNRATQYDGSYCLRPLTRDARRPLTYAAEYADPTLILTLLEAGADKAAKDTEGNSISWYLDRNKTLSERQREVLKSRLAP